MEKEDQNLEEKFLDESGYTMDIPEEEWPKSEAEFNKLKWQEGNLRKLMKMRGIIIDPSMELDQIVELIRDKKQEQFVLEWAYTHRKNRTIMRKKNETIMIVPTTQLLLRASDLLKH